MDPGDEDQARATPTELTLVDLNYNHLFYFHLVATSGSLTAAAETAAVKQPTISEQILKLEQRLGVLLFHRDPRGMTPTLAGRALLAHTVDMFRAAERITQALPSMRQMDLERCG